MQVSVTHQPGSIVELQIEVPVEQVERAIERAYGRLSAQVRVPGFRPGRAPRPVLERTIGWPALREQAIELLVPDAVGEAVTQNQLQAIATPEVAIESFERLQPARIMARVTVKPEVQLGDFRSLRVPLPAVEVGTDKVDQSLQELRESLAVLAPAENRAVRAGDVLVCDVEVFRDGQPVEEKPSTAVQMEVNAETLIPGLFDGVVGMTSGETRDIDIVLPDDYGRPELSGQKVVFHLTVKEVKERVLPELDDELARQAGVGETLEGLRQETERRLRAAAERDAVFTQQKGALDALIAASKFEVPELLVEAEIDREIRNLAVNLQQQGIDFQRFLEYGGADLGQMRTERRPAAEDRVRQELVLDALADAVGLEPTDEHVAAEAQRTLEGASDAERLASSDRVRAYVHERLRLQWALLWLAEAAQGKEWSPPAPAQPAAPIAETAAAEEVLEESGLVEL